MAKSTKGMRRIQFTLEAPNARQVFVAGDFNGWSNTRHPLKQGADGTWSVSLMLAPGRYEYKFLVDDSWESDPDNARQSRNVFGTWNNVLIVPMAR